MAARPIVVAYDGSPRGEAALCWALDEGVRRGLPVCLSHVLDETTCSRAAAESAVARRARKADDWGRLGVPVAGEVLTGDVAIALCARSRSASLLVIGDRGHGGFAGQRIGSVSLAVAMHAHCPVVVVRDPPPASTRRPVAVGVDDPPERSLALGVALSEARARGVGLLAVRACPRAARPFAGPLPPTPATLIDSTGEERRLIGAVTAWREQFPDVEVTIRVVPVTPVHALTVVSRDVQLVVVGSRAEERGGASWSTNVGQQLLHHALCSVMVVRGTVDPSLLARQTAAA